MGRGFPIKKKLLDQKYVYILVRLLRSTLKPLILGKILVVNAF